MVTLNKAWKIIVGSVIALALWTFISVNTLLFNDGEEFRTFEYIISYVLSLGIWGLIALKFDFSNITKKLSAIAVMFFTPFLCLQISTIFADKFEFTIGVYLLNILIYAVIMAIMFGITRSIRFSVSLTVIIAYLFALSSFVIQILRGTPLIPGDFFAIDTAINVADQYKFCMKYEIIAASVLTVFYVVLAWKLSVPIRFKRKNIIIPCSCAVFVLAALISAQTVDYDKINMDFFDQQHANKTHGMALSFYINTRRMTLEKPDNYSEKEASSILPSVSKKTTPQTTPNILVIMNESLSDLSEIGEFKTNIDYMPFIRSLTNNTIRGKVIVSPFGGYTCNSEFEFLTGMTMGLLPQGSSPYLQYLTVPQLHSLPNHLKNFGYKNIALHPYYARSWNREKVYGLMGFDKFISMDNMGDYQDRNQFEYIRCYMSDRTSYSAAINQFTSKKANSPMFIFNITMQNHGGYSYYLGAWKNTVKITDMKGDYPETEQYLSLIRESDIAFKALTDWFSKWNEPTVILMFGDHQPGIEQEFYEELYGKDLLEVEDKELVKRYTVPFIIWANYDIEEKSNIITSTNYLQNLLLDTAGLSKSSVGEFTQSVQEQIPAINALGHYDAAGNWYTNDFEKDDSDKDETRMELLNKYRNLEYYLLTVK